MWNWIKKLFYSPKPKEIETLIYVGEGRPNESFIGLPVDLDGRKGKVIAYTALTITVEWEE